MKGYISFLLVSVSALLLSSLIRLSYTAGCRDMSKSIMSERAYSLEMNGRESAAESLWQGAEAGFSEYDSRHSVAMCRHCLSDFCVLAPAPNYCDPGLCDLCFRADDAKLAAETKASSSLAALQANDLDLDFRTMISTPLIRAVLEPANLSRNGFRLGAVILASDSDIDSSSKRFDISASTRIPSGTVISYG